MGRITVIFLLALVVSPLKAQTIHGLREGYVEGNVADNTGKPVGGAKIDVVGAKVSKKGIKANDDCGFGFALSSANGNFAVGVGWNNMCVTKEHPINGNYFVTVSKRGFLPQQQVISLAPGPATKGGVNFTLQPSDATIQISVVSAAGPLPYADVVVMKNPFSRFVKLGVSSTGQYNGTGKVSMKKGHFQWMMSSMPIFQSDKNGRATIPVSPGDYEVISSKAGYTLTTQNPNPLMQWFYGNMAQQMQAMAAAEAKAGSPSGAALAGRGAAAGRKVVGLPQPGVFLHVVANQTAVANLVMTPSVPAGSVPSGGAPAGAGAATVASAPRNVSPKSVVRPRFILSGAAVSSPNNVLFFTIVGGPPSGSYMAGIVRSRIPLGTGKIDPFKAHLKTFNYAAYGWPEIVGKWQPSSSQPYIDIWSFTDPTGKPGTTYYYYITVGSMPSVSGGNLRGLMEIGQPYSNALVLVTH